jgi:hypothetical protein
MAATNVDKICNTIPRKKDIQNGCEIIALNMTLHTILEYPLCAAPYTSREKVYCLDQRANEISQPVTRLSPYRCQYNPSNRNFSKQVSWGVVASDLHSGSPELEYRPDLPWQIFCGFPQFLKANAGIVTTSIMAGHSVTKQFLCLISFVGMW